MSESTGLAPGTAARVIHGALCTGLLVATGVTWLAAQQMPPSELPALVVYLPLVVGAGMFSAAVLLRSRLLDGGSVSSADWWRANLQRAILLWALLEGPALFGAVIYLVSRQWIPLVATGVGFLLLVLHSPALLRPE